VDAAAQKGAKESFIMLDSTGLVVSIKNRKVITAMDLEKNIITNIDSAIIC
jgi:Protein of unknown function (DUF3766).